MAIWAPTARRTVPQLVASRPVDFQFHLGRGVMLIWNNNFELEIVGC